MANVALFMTVVYTVKAGQRSEFYGQLVASGVIEKSREEAGNRQYDYYFPAENDDEILLLEAWVDQGAQEDHAKTAHYQALQSIKAAYVENVRIAKYVALA